MKMMLKVELKRAFCSWYFVSSLLIGMGIALLHELTFVLPAAERMKHLVEFGAYPNSLFNSWIGAMLASLPNTLFYFLLPIIATIPHAKSFFDDRENGVMQNICVRTRKKHYLLSKYISVFLSGAVPVAIALIFSLWLTALSIPSLMPDPSTGTFSLVDNNMWSKLFYSHPFVYVSLFILIDAIFAGLLSTIALCAALFVENKFIVSLSPFIVYLITYFVVELNFNSKYNPVHFLNPAQPSFTTPWIILIFGAVLFFIPFIAYYFGSIKKDVI